MLAKVNSSAVVRLDAGKLRYNLNLRLIYKQIMYFALAGRAILE